MTREFVAGTRDSRRISLSRRIQGDVYRLVVRRGNDGISVLAIFTAGPD